LNNSNGNDDNDDTNDGNTNALSGSSSSSQSDDHNNNDSNNNNMGRLTITANLYDGGRQCRYAMMKDSNPSIVVLGGGNNNNPPSDCHYYNDCDDEDAETQNENPDHQHHHDEDQQQQYAIGKRKRRSMSSQSQQQRHQQPLHFMTMVCVSSLLLLSLLSPVVQAQTSPCVASAGTYCPATTGSDIACPAGYYCPGDPLLSDHIACPVGTFNDLTGQSSLSTACQTCAVGFVALATGQSSCQQCAAGSVYASASVCNLCSGGRYALQGDSSCSACAPGSTSSAGASACSTCRPGTFSSASASPACTACPTGTYTFGPDPSVAAGTGYLPVWGATAQSQCAENPGKAASQLVCLPGTYIVGAGCVACPIGYYCPHITVYPSGITNGQIRICPAGTSTPTAGALSTTDCSITTPLLSLNMAQCAVTPGDVSAITSLSVTAMATSADTKAVYFTTATAVYRLFLQTNTLELMAGMEGSAATDLSAPNAVGTAARFSSLTAIAVDLDQNEASIVVVGDGSAIRLIDVYTRSVTLMGGSVGDISSAGGIALRRDSTGLRWAYVSDSVENRIQMFSIENPTQERVMVVGDIGGTAGYKDASAGSALFNTPMGLAFLEYSLNSSRTLLVADSGNGVIRAVDTVTRSVQTWFAPRDTVTPEMSTPVGISVSPQYTIVYVADSGLQHITAIQSSSSLNPSVVVSTALTLEGTSNAGARYVAVAPYGIVSTGSGSVVGYSELLVLDGKIMTTKQRQTCERYHYY
jgi:hypothetical protein